MGRNIISPEKRKKRAEKASAEFNTSKRARHLYNFIYKRSKFFKASIYIRVITLIFSIYMVYFNSSILISSEKEIVSNCVTDELNVYNKTGARDHKILVITTSLNNQYSLPLMNPKPEYYYKNDTITVVKNIFGKKTYLIKSGQTKLNILIKFSRYSNYLIFIIGLTLFSFLLIDGYDMLSKVVIRFTLFINISGILLYFVL